MEEKQKSAVEFLESQYHFNKQLSARDFKEAKEMEGSQATMKTSVEQIIDEFKEELKVAIAIGNEDKIRIIKHLITISTLHLPKEKEQIIEFACDVYDLNYGKDKSFRKQAEDFYNQTFKNK